MQTREDCDGDLVSARNDDRARMIEDVLIEDHADLEPACREREALLCGDPGLGTGESVEHDRIELAAPLAKFLDRRRRILAPTDQFFERERGAEDACAERDLISD